MAVLKCKMCGGPIRVMGPRIGECEDCGTRVLLPIINEERIVNLYNRGNHFREVGEYDRAYSAYESIIAQDRDDAEAHWCLLLCRYGINYVKDDRTGAFRPTLSRMNRSPINEDPDYLAALRCSDEEMKQWYRQEAAKLADIQNLFLEIMKKEPPYDVFICFKAEEADGRRTKASELGQDIYEELTARGLQVFFSRITLADRIGEEFEPYIFSALYTARVMLVVADKAEQLQARWVKNEWIRYLAMMDRDSERTIVPVFYQMSPYDFPPEIPMVQGQDMERLGAMQDLAKNVLALCRKAPEKVRLMTGLGEEKAVFDLDNALSRIRTLLEDGDFEAVAQRLAEVLKRKPESGEAWYCQLLLTNRACGWRELMRSGCCWFEDEMFVKARKYGGDALQRELDELEAECLREQKYRRMRESMERAAYEEAYPLAKELDGYKDTRRYRQECETYFERQAHLKRYREEIGDSSTYVERRLKQDYPEKYKEYQRKKETLEGCKLPLLDYGIWPLVVAIVCGILFCKVLVETKDLMLTAQSFAVLGVIALGVFIGIKCESLIVGGLCIALMIWGVGRFPENVIGVIGLVLGVAIPLVCVPSTIMSMRWNSAWNAEDGYYHGTIEPLEKKIIEEASGKWGPLVGVENLMELKPTGKSA